jgi:hypothetical protein
MQLDELSIFAIMYCQIEADVVDGYHDATDAPKGKLLTLTGAALHGSPIQNV